MRRMRARELPRGFLTLATLWKKAQLRRPGPNPQSPARIAPRLPEYRCAGNEKIAGQRKAARCWPASWLIQTYMPCDRDSSEGHVHRGPSERNLVTTRLKS